MEGPWLAAAAASEFFDLGWNSEFVGMGVDVLRVGYFGDKA